MEWSMEGKEKRTSEVEVDEGDLVQDIVLLTTESDQFCDLARFKVQKRDEGLTLKMGTEERKRATAPAAPAPQKTKVGWNFLSFLFDQQSYGCNVISCGFSSQFTWDDGLRGNVAQSLLCRVNESVLFN
jgi:hypothetical protein